MNGHRTLGERVDLLQSLHASTKRDYLARVVADDKAQCAAVAGQFDRDYWDGERRFGYGGYAYDGRWRPIAERLVDRYGLTAGMRVLDVGCGKAYLLYELLQLVPGLQIAGIDISRYAIENAKDEVRPALSIAAASSLPFENDAFDFVFSLATLHNLGLAELWPAVAEIERVGKRAKYIMIESYRNEREKTNLLYWQLTCKSFYSVVDWEWLYRKIGYTGDYGFIFFQ